jgi:hypothetical protein
MHYLLLHVISQNWTLWKGAWFPYVRQELEPVTIGVIHLKVTHSLYLYRISIEIQFIHQLSSTNQYLSYDRNVTFSFLNKRKVQLKLCTFQPVILYGISKSYIKQCFCIFCLTSLLDHCVIDVRDFKVWRYAALQWWAFCSQFSTVCVLHV